MQKTQMLIQEIEKLVGSDVVIFGKVQKIQEPSPFYIRIVDVLKELQPYEVTSFEILTVDDEIHEAESIDEYLEYLDDLYGLKKIDVGNSYNNNSPIDHHFNYCIYHDQLNYRYLVEFSVHKYGDVRTNYTDSVLYSFEHIDDFFATVEQASYYKKLGSYSLEASAFQDGWRLYDEEGEEIAQIFDEQDILEFVNS